VPRLLHPALYTTGSVLFALDLVCVMVAWSLVLWVAYPSYFPHLAPPFDLRSLTYPVTDLLLLYAMGLYRRDAILWTGRALSPRAAGRRHGHVWSPCCYPWCHHGSKPSLFAHPGGRDETLGFGLAFISFTLCAFLARLWLDLLLQGHVLRRHLLVVGAGQRAWDLLHMLTKEGGSLSYDIAFLHHDGLGRRSTRGLPSRRSSDTGPRGSRPSCMPAIARGPYRGARPGRRRPGRHRPIAPPGARRRSRTSGCARRDQPPAARRSRPGRRDAGTRCRSSGCRLPSSAWQQVPAAARRRPPAMARSTWPCSSRSSTSRARKAHSVKLMKARPKPSVSSCHRDGRTGKARSMMTPRITAR